MLAHITALLIQDGINVENMSNKSRGDYAYTIVDLGTAVEDSVIEDVAHLENVIRVREKFPDVRDWEKIWDCRICGSPFSLTDAWKTSKIKCVSVFRKNWAAGICHVCVRSSAG